MPSMTQKLTRKSLYFMGFGDPVMQALIVAGVKTERRRR
jgi:presenilin-like A22 family membrane protease